MPHVVQKETTRAEHYASMIFSGLVWSELLYLWDTNMAILRCFGQVTLLSIILFHVTSSLAQRDRNEDDLERIIMKEISHINMQSLFSKKYEDALVEAKLRLNQEPGLERRRQLGDIEFSNRYAEYLRSKAKQSSMCAFLRRMQGVKKSGLEEDSEKVGVLLKQYMCPPTFPWSSDK